MGLLIQSQITTARFISSEHLDKIRKKDKLAKILYSIRKDEDGGYSISSQKDANKLYNVYFYKRKNKFTCTCMFYSLHPDKKCMHIDAVEIYDKYYNDILETGS